MPPRPRLLLVAFLIGSGVCMEVIPESVKLIYTNEKYVTNVVTNIRRYSRKNPIYYFNLSGELKHSWANNITIHITMTQYLHNEYRRSFVEFNYKLCDLINNEPYFGSVIRSKGISCPIPKGKQSIFNATANTANFPNVFPFEKGGAELVLMTDTGDVVGRGEAHGRIVQKQSG